jgi:probable HAF family extracellular repeat protein
MRQILIFNFFLSFLSIYSLPLVGQSFEVLPSNARTANAVSPDGSVIVGMTTDNNAYFWNAEDGIIVLGMLPGMTSSSANDVSLEGRVVVGESSKFFPSERRAFRWTLEDGMIDIGAINNSQSNSALGVSSDGSVVVGHSDRQAFRWTAGGGMVGIGFLPGHSEISYATGISSDGQVIIGMSSARDPNTLQAFQWSTGTNMVPVGYPLDNSYGISADGSTIVGSLHPSNNNGILEAYRWIATTGIMGLGIPPGYVASQAIAVSGNGNIMVGQSRLTMESGYAATIWYEMGTPSLLQDVLTDDYGLDLNGYILREATDISDDGNVIVGWATNQQNQRRVFRVVIQNTEDKPIQVNSNADRPLKVGKTNCETGETIEINGVKIPECTLRAALQTAAARGGENPITFNIPGSGPHTISLIGLLPDVPAQTIVDATSQPGYNGLPLITLNGGESIENGLVLEQGESVVRGLSIGGFTNVGILITGAGENIVEASHIGINATGTAALPNRTGLIIDNSPGNKIGGPDPGQMNVISANTDSRDDVKMNEERTGVGILIQGAGSTGNQVQGNRVGTDFAGQQAIGNGYVGVYIYDASDNLIGGDETTHGNLISANANGNVYIFGQNATDNIISGNIIGTNLEGTASLSENSGGISILFGSRNIIGGPSGMPGTAPGNLISGHGKGGGVILAGINPEAVSSETDYAASGIASENIIAGNLIGTNRDGTSALPNQSGVVAVYDAHKTQIGGDQAGYRNIISGNGFGIILADTTGGFAPHGSVIAGNYIGTNINGNVALGNSGPGIMVNSLSRYPDESTGIAGVRIGGISDASRNIVAGNREMQIEIVGPVSAGTVIMNNYIGVLANGQAGQTPADSEYGLMIKTDGTLIGEDSEGNIVPNVIGGNQYGIVLVGNMNLVGGGNKIGTNPGGTVAVPNHTGIWVLGNGNNILKNTISGNKNYGIEIGQKQGSPFEGIYLDPDNTTIARNMIGTNSQGSNAIGNGIGENGAGVAFWRKSNLHLYYNTISGNHHGVEIDNSPFEATFMAGNIIGAGGIDPIDIEDGSVLPEFISIPNQGDGVHITDGNVYIYDEPNTEPFSELGNFIQNNLGAGIRRTGSNLSNDFEILSNFFFNNTGLAIDFGPEGAGTGDALHEPPVMMQPVIEEETARIRGLSAVNGRIQLYTTPICHPSGHGEGRLYLLAEDQIVSAGQQFSTEVSLPENLRVGYYVTALVTHNKRTSEFCKCVRIVDKEKYQEQLLEDLAREALKLGRLTIESNETKSLTINNNKNSLQEIEAVVYASEFNLPPDHSYFQGSALAPDGTEITPNTIDTTLYWTVGAVNVPAFAYNVCVDVSGTAFIQKNQIMVLVHRNGIGSPWKPLDTSVDDNNILCASGLTVFGDIAIATYDESVATTIALFDNQTESNKPITLLQNYPNPFAASTKIPFEITETGKVEVLIIDNLGRTVKSLVNQTLPAGKHEVTFEGTSIPEGMYFYQIKGNGFSETRKMVKIR